MTKEEIESIKLNIKNAFANIRFNKENHQYVYNGVILESSSSFRKEFENSFEAYFSAESKYKSNLKYNPDTKRTAAYYRERWDLLGQEARIRGTRVHLFSETYPDFDEPSCDKERGVTEFFEQLDPKYVLIFQELIMFDAEFYKAGTADLIFLNIETGNLVIGDWKTNDKSIFENYKGKSLKGEFKSYKDTSYNKYSMQLSHYQYILEKYTGMKIEDRWLIWLSTSSKKKEHKDYTYQKINPKHKGKYFRSYSCRNMTERLGKSLESRREKIVMNLKHEPLSTGKLSMDSLEGLKGLLPELPKTPTMKKFTFNTVKENANKKVEKEKKNRKSTDSFED